eukprot:PITA_11812
MGKNLMLTESVGPDQIAEVVSRWTGSHVTRLGQNENERLIGLADSWSVLMFEYIEQHSVARLIGAPPGYVGYEEGGQLTEAVRRRLYSVVLFYEVEKAHTSVFNTLLQMLDDGRLKDGQGRTVSFSNRVAEHLLACCIVWPHNNKNPRENVMQEVCTRIPGICVRRHFRPGLLNRLDEIVVFDPLSHDELKKVARLQMKDVAIRLAERGVALGVTDDALDLVLQKGYDPVYGAHPLRRWLKSKVVAQLSWMLISGEIDENSTVYIDAVPEQQTLSYRVDRNVGIVNQNTGAKLDILIEIPNSAYFNVDASQAVKKMRIEEIEADEPMEN